MQLTQKASDLETQENQSPSPSPSLSLVSKIYQI